MKINEIWQYGNKPARHITDITLNYVHYVEGGVPMSCTKPWWKRWAKNAKRIENEISM